MLRRVAVFATVATLIALLVFVVSTPQQHSQPPSATLPPRSTSAPTPLRPTAEPHLSTTPRTTNSPATVSRPWRAALGKIALDSPSLSRAVIEVGTSSSPEFSALVRQRPDVLYIGVDPIANPVKLFSAACAGMTERCVVIPAAIVRDVPSSGRVRLNLGTNPDCSSLLSNGKRCAASNESVEVDALSLAGIVTAIPASILARERAVEVAVDCQGADLECLQSLFLPLPSRPQTPAIRHVGTVLAECQDLPQRSHQLLYQTAQTCGAIQSCLADHDFEFVSATANFEISEYNVLFRPRNHTTTERTVIHGHPKGGREWPRIKHRAHCPRS